MSYYKTSAHILFSLIIFMLCVTGKLLASNENEKSFENIFNLIYDHQFDEATFELTQSKNSLERWSYQMLILDLHWWKAISSNLESDYAIFESVLAKYSSESSNNQNYDSLEELIYQSYYLRFAALKNRFVSLMSSMYRINQIIGRLEIDKLTLEQQEIFKIFQALFNIVKSKLYFNNLKLRDEGIKVLETNLNSTNPVYQTISCYFLSKIYFEFYNSPEIAGIYFEKLCVAYPGNKVFIRNLELCK